MEKVMKQMWWKYLGVFILILVIWFGFMHSAPRLDILNETIRAVHFHVPMWFGMMILLTFSLVYSIKFLRSNKLEHDLIAVETANIGILFGILGLLTGSIWAKFTWGSWWNGDPKQNMAAIFMLIYLAYSVTRSSIDDPEKRGKISAIYNIFAFASLIPLLFIIPRLTDSLHPSNGGNQGFVTYDMNNDLKIIFYPAVIGWTIIGLWAASLRVRLRTLEYRLLKLI